MYARLILVGILLTHILILAQSKPLVQNNNLSLTFSTGIDIGHSHYEKQNILSNEPTTKNEYDVVTARANDDVSNESTNKKSNKRNQVKLTSKQGFILNQLLGTYAIENMVNSLCRNHTQKFKTAVRAFEPWALKMIDSSSKLQAGLLLGNLVEYGSYSQCLRIYTETEYGPIMGKHCLIKIAPSDDLILSVLKVHNLEGKKKFAKKEMFQMGWSVCVPHSCPAEDIERHFNKTIMEVTVGVDLEVSLNQHYCRTQMDYPEIGPIQYAALAFYGSFVLLGILASTIQTNKANKSAFTDIFSAKEHLSYILKLYSPGEYDFLYGLRFISSSFVVIGHRFIMFMIFPVINGIDELEWPARYPSLIIIGSTVCVDSFFMVSGMLVSMGFLKHVVKTGNFNIATFYLYRYLRITLPMALVVLFYVTLAQFLADGPYAYDVYMGHQKPCEDYWWSILLHLQTIVNPGHLCLFPLWYLSCEMQFYFFSPLILYPLWKWPKLGYATLIGSYLGFMGLAFYLAWTNKYEGTPLPITSQLLYLDFFQKFYIAPHVRAPSYIIGLAFGYFLFVTRNRKIKLSPRVRYLGWAISCAVLVLSAGGCHNFYLETYKYNRLEATSYLTFARPGWTLGMIWIIWCCMNGYGGILDEFLSAYIFKILGKLTYGFFLMHSVIQVYMGASSKVSNTFSNFNAVYTGLADIMMCIILGLFFTIFFEMPLNRLQALMFTVKANTTAADESLLEHFSCLICLEYMDKKIYICVNGHSICGGCNSKVLKCPVCNVKRGVLRNINLEKAAKKFKEWKGKQANPKRITILKDIQRRRVTSLGSPIRTKPDDFGTDNHIQCPHSQCCYFTKQLLQLKIHLQTWHSNQLYNIKKQPETLSEEIIRVRVYFTFNALFHMFVLSSPDAYFIVYIGKHQAQDGIEVHNDTIKTQKRGDGYNNYLEIFITRVAAL